MQPTRFHKTGLPALAVALILIAVPASADLTVKSRSQLGGFGPNKIGNMTVESTLKIKADKGYEQTTSEFGGKVLKRFTGNMTDERIHRPDKGLFWTLMSKRKAYSETRYEVLRQRLAQLDPRGVAGAQAVDAGADGPRKESMEWSAPEVESRSKGDAESIAGYPTQETEISVTSVGTHKESGKTCTVRWKTGIWSTTKIDGIEEYRAYNKKLAEALGITLDFNRMGANALAQLGTFGDGLTEVSKLLAEAHGFPLRTQMQVFVDGEACAGAAPGVAGGGEEAPVANPGLKGIGRKMLGKFRRGKELDEGQEPAAGAGEPAAAKAPEGPVELFAMHTEVVEISNAEIAAQTFEVDPQWKRVEPEDPFSRLEQP